MTKPPPPCKKKPWQLNLQVKTNKKILKKEQNFCFKTSSLLEKNTHIFCVQVIVRKNLSTETSFPVIMHMVSNTVFGMPRHSTPAHSSSLLEQTINIRTDKLGAFKIFFSGGNYHIFFLFCNANSDQVLLSRPSGLATLL